MQVLEVTCTVVMVTQAETDREPVSADSEIWLGRCRANTALNTHLFGVLTVEAADSRK